MASESERQTCDQKETTASHLASNCSFRSREVIARLLNTVLDPEQDRRLPLIKLTHLIVLE